MDTAKMSLEQQLQELEKLREREQKRKSVQLKYREKQKQNPKQITAEEKQKKADYMREYGRKLTAKRQKQRDEKRKLIYDFKLRVEQMSKEDIIKQVQNLLD